MMGRHETHASPAQQRIANLMPVGGLADAGGSKGLGVAAFVFEEDESQPTFGLAAGPAARDDRRRKDAT